MEKTLIIIKPGALQRGLCGEIIKRFESKGFQISGMKMIQLNEKIINEHYSHLLEKSFFPQIKQAMMRCPVIVCCLEGTEAVEVVRQMIGITNGREALMGTIRGDFSMSVQENVVHASDSVENATIEIKRFFADEEIYTYQKSNINEIYAIHEI